MVRVCVLGWVITDFAADGDSAQQVLAAVHSDIGVPLAACQHACCSQCNRNSRSDPPPVVPKCKRKRPSQIRSCWRAYGRLTSARRLSALLSQTHALHQGAPGTRGSEQPRPSHSTGGLNPDPWTGGRHAHLKRGQLNWSQLCSSSK